MVVEKLMKALDTLKNSPVKKKDPQLTTKDKSVHAQMICENIQTPEIKQNPDYGKLFSSSFEILFSLCDDVNADVRIVAEECINSIIKNCLFDGNITRVHIELYKELRRNGSARSLRSVLCKFASLADQIRPQKCRIFAVNLVPCLVTLVRRPEDSIQECLEKNISKFFASLGKFFNDEEIKILVKSILPNLQLSSAQARRCAANFLTELCKYARKRPFFISYLFKNLLDLLIPVQYDQNINHIVGILTTFRLLCPLLKECDDKFIVSEFFTSHSTTLTRSSTNYSTTVDHLLQFYEILLYYMCYSNNSVATCALETLSALLQNLPRRLSRILKSNKGIDQSRIFLNPEISASGLRSRKQSFTGLSTGISSLTCSQNDLTLTVGDLSIFNNTVNYADSSIVNSLPGSPIPSHQELNKDEKSSQNIDSKNQEDQEVSLLSPNGGNAYTNVSIGQIMDDDDDDDALIDISEDKQNKNEEVVAESDTRDTRSASPASYLTSTPHRIVNRPLATLNKLTLKDSVRSLSSPATPMSPDSASFSAYPENIESFTDNESPLIFCARCLCGKFLLRSRRSLSPRPASISPAFDVGNELNFPNSALKMDNEENFSDWLLSDKEIRVSQKVLALNCLSNLIELDSSLLLLPLNTCNNSPRIINVLHYATHSDHLLRGETANLAASWLKSEYFSRKCLNLFAVEKNDYGHDLIKVIQSTLSDTHFSAARSALLALDRCQNYLLRWHSDRKFAYDVLQTLYYSTFNALHHTYWAVKLAALEMWSNFDFATFRYLELKNEQENLHKTTDCYQNKVVNVIINDLLADESIRVRNEACLTLCKAIKSFYFVENFESSKFISCLIERKKSLTSSNFVWFHNDFSKIHNLPKIYDQKNGGKSLTNWQEANLSYILVELCKILSFPKDTLHLSGCLNALCKLAETYPPSQYYSSWITVVSNDQERGAIFLGSLLQILSGLSLGTECIMINQSILSLISNLFAGYVCNQQSKMSTPNDTFLWPMVKSQQLADSASDTITYCLRILSIFYHVITETTPAAPPIISKPQQIPHLVTQQTLTPVAQKIKAVAASKLETGKTGSGEKGDSTLQNVQPVSFNKATKLGEFYGIGHFMRLYDIVKGGWTNYKASLEEDVAEKFHSLLRSCLKCLSIILEAATLKVVEKFSEEILTYLKPLMTILPYDIINTVTQVLKALFSTNLNICLENTSANNSNVLMSGGGGGMTSSPSCLFVFDAPFSLYQTCIVKTRTKFAQSMAASTARHDLLNDPLNRHMGWFGSRADKHVVNLLKKPAHKTILTNYIRLFEPVVVQALRYYTSSVDTDSQQAVISLLIQLVQIRVNYCLLDNDQRFLNFLFQQLENVEEANLTNASGLVNCLFEFFIILSYEKYQNKSVLDVPKILQLVDSLLASVGSDENLGLSALHSVVIDLFLLRPSAKLESAKDLEIQQECVASVLMKSIDCVQALDLFTFILYRTRRENESKWKKLSRDIVDLLLPYFSKGQISFSNVESFQTCLNFVDFLCSGAFRPADATLELFFKPPLPNCIELEQFSNWLCVNYICFYVLVLHCKEDAILSRLETLKLSTQFDFNICQNYRKLLFDSSDLIGSLNSDSKKEPDDFFDNSEAKIAHLMKTICEMAFNEFLYYLTSSDHSKLLTSLLETVILHYLQLMIHICQIGSFRKISTALSAQFCTNLNKDCIFSLANLCPELVIQFLYLLSTLNVYNDEIWLKLVYNDDGINETVSFVARILYADHLKAEIKNTNLSNCPQIVERKCKFAYFIDLLEEPPICELTGIFNKNLLISRIFFHEVDPLISNNHISVKKKANILKCVQNLHPDLHIRVCHFLTRCLSSPFYFIANLASQILLQKLDSAKIGTVTDEDVSVVKSIVEELDSPKISRFQRIRSIFLEHYSSYIEKHPSIIESRDSEIDSVFNSTPANKFKKPKFMQIVRILTRRPDFLNENCLAEILSTLNREEIIELLSDWDVPGILLEACISRNICKFLTLEDCQNQDKALKIEKSKAMVVADISFAAIRALLSALKPISLKIFKDLDVKFEENSFLFSCSIDEIEFWNYCERLLNYVGSTNLLFGDEKLLTILTDSDFQTLFKFCYVLTLVLLKYFHRIPLTQCLSVIKVIINLFYCDNLFSLFSCQNLNLQRSLIGSTYFLLMKICKFSDLRLQNNFEPIKISGIDEDRRIIWQFMQNLLICFEKEILKNSFQSKNTLNKISLRLITGVARLPYACSFSRVPTSVYKYGWDPDVRITENGLTILSTVPVRYLQNVDVLYDFMFRVQWLGWTSRQDFEEIWMGLLGVLSATPVGQELQAGSVQEIAERVSASTVAVRCLSGLLIKTLLYPNSGNPLSTKYVYKHREKESTFLKSSSGQRLLFLKQKIHDYLRDSSKNFDGANDFHSNNDLSSLYAYNVERLHNVDDYWFAQFSVDTLWSLTGILAEEENLISSSNSSPTVIDARSVDNSGDSGLETSKPTDVSAEPEEIDAPNLVTTPLLEKFSIENTEKEISSVSLVDVSSPEIVGVDEKSIIGHSKSISLSRSVSEIVLSAQNELNLSSCLHFLLDLFGHWLSSGPDAVALPLLSATVESVILLSDLFTERSQYVWFKEKLTLINQNRSIDDEIIMQDVAFGILKASAILGSHENEKEKEQLNFIDQNLHQTQLSVRISTLHGVLYLLQTMTSDEIVGLMPILSEYILSNLSVYALFDGENFVLDKPQSLDHQLILWSIGFFIVESFHDPHTKQSFAPKFLEICLKALRNKNIIFAIFNAVSAGLERLLVNSTLDLKFIGQFAKFSSEFIEENDCSEIVIIAVELLLACLYSAKENRRTDEIVTPDSENAPTSFGERTVSAMEKLSVLLSRITRGNRKEASAVARILPYFLADNFNPGDVMNKIITELLQNSQPYPQLLMRILLSVVKELLNKEAKTVVCDWILLSIPSFTHKDPCSFSIWCLTCLFLCSSSNDYVRKIWKIAQNRLGRDEKFDENLFYFATDCFCHQLEEKHQLDSFKLSIGEAAKRNPESYYEKVYDKISC